MAVSESKVEKTVGARMDRKRKMRMMNDKTVEWIYVMKKKTTVVAVMLEDTMVAVILEDTMIAFIQLSW
jgi:hypothetical protein